MSGGGRLGIIAALPKEAGALLGSRPRAGQLYPHGAGALVAVAGMGPERARAAAQGLVEQGAAALVSWGTCGALDAALAATTAVVPGRVLADGPSLPCNQPWHGTVTDLLGRSSVDLSTGPLLSAPAPVGSPVEKLRLGGSSGAVAVDMESYAVAAVAAAAGLPFIAIRAVVDRADQALPKAALVALRPDGRVDLSRFLVALARRPQDLLALVAVGRAFRAACGTLERLGAVLGPTLARPAAAGSGGTRR